MLTTIPKTGTGKLGGSAEPGIVFVSKDANGNGKPDDEWYELKGSEYGKDTETREYEITYYRPNLANQNVFWKDNKKTKDIFSATVTIIRNPIIHFG